MAITVRVQGANMEITPSIYNYVVKKIEMLDKYVNPEDTSALCDVEIGKTTAHHRSGDIFKAEFNLHIAHKYFYTVAEKEDLYAAIDEVKDEMAEILTHEKDKRISLLKRGGRKVKRILRGWYRK
ncbi:MAG: ribosome-associated translation inhibitor RaiA [bacterium]|nr:ribosome-associated translation inhibitor RaiA [bacterium]